jgi:hypothetical protein
VSLSAPPNRRESLERPYRRESERSLDAKLRHPQSLREYINELRDAVEAEIPERLHQSGVEVEGDKGGSHLGTPRWTADFRRYIAGSPYATYEEGTDVQWVSPHRSALARMENGSAVTRAAAGLVYLLPLHRYSTREAWSIQVGRLANTQAMEAADAWAYESLRRWWVYYCEQPRGRPI